MIDAANTAGIDLAEVGPLSAGPADADPLQVLCTAFQGQRLVAAGELGQILPALSAAQELDPDAPLLVFEDGTSRLVEVDLRRSVHAPNALDPHDRAGAERKPMPVAGAEAGGEARRAAGRPRLGVVAREVTLLPRHWEWLNRQPGGASVALRKLVDEARKARGGHDRVRQAQEVAYRFLLAMGGNLPGYEEALRALFAGKRERFAELLAPWPADVREHALRLAADAFPIGAQASGTGESR